VLAAARAQGLMIATAESCTGGLVAGALTDIAGSSDVVERGFVTYSNVAKHEMLGVPDSADRGAWRGLGRGGGRDGAGRAQTLARRLAVAITGVAGPGGGRRRSRSDWCISPCGGDGRVNRIEKRYGDIGRSKVRAKAVNTALTLLLDLLKDSARQVA
jgi:nicotinamide-nucleotide amidase